MSADFSGPVLTAGDQGVHVAADASLFYKSELRRKLADKGILPLSDAPAHLILAAYSAWGRACVEELEGDFAFVLWDESRGALFAARDFNGRRPLFHAMVGETLVVASSIRAVLGHPGCPHDVDPVTVAEQAGGLTGSATETCYRQVSRLPSGCWLEFRPGRSAPRISRFWTPPLFADSGPSSVEEGVEELRRLLTAAITERLASAGSTAISLSGGHDSPLVFALGAAALAGARSSRSLQPVSISYPEGNPGREDELIQEIVSHWGASARWIDSRGVPFVESLLDEAAERDEAFSHAFHRIFRAVMAAAGKLGASVVLDGHGGDFLFQVSPRYHADLFRTGSWWELAREWRANGGGTWRDFIRSALIPVLPSRAVRVASAARGRPIHPPSFSRQPPPWFRKDFVAKACLLERESAHQPSRAGMGMAAYESSWYLTAQPFMRAASVIGDLALGEGGEARSPFLDERVIRFAARRPRRERRSGGETKRLLRAASSGLLPAHLNEPRPFKTGVMSGYFNDGCLRLLDSLDAENAAPALSELGVVDPGALRDACVRFRRSNSNVLASLLLATLSADAWLRTRSQQQLRVQADGPVTHAPAA
jgi:asparagine synthase (glutamine-hydrolysing)